MIGSRSRHLVDPQLLPLLDILPPFELSLATLPEMRASPPRFTVDPNELDRSELSFRSILGPAGAPEIRLSIYQPKPSGDVLPCILHIHGGGFVAGSAAALEATNRQLAATLRCCVISVDYRLAPETKFPGAIEDCYAALSWIFENAVSLGVDPGRIGVMGESAGGGLAAALALMARDRGEFTLRFQHLIYPMLDDRTCTLADPHPYTGEFIWNANSNIFAWHSLLGFEPGSPGISPYAAPARAVDLSGLPPTYIATGALDLFLEENIDYARRLSRSEVPLEMHIYPGAFHAFNWAPTADVSVRFRQDSLRALASAFCVGNTG